MRIITGAWRGRRITAPDGRDVRPTTDRVREAIFGSLGARIDGANVLDVFGGSGALGIESASRGAAKVVIIEKSRKAQSAIRANLASVGSPPQIQLICAPYERAMKALDGRMQFDIIFLDPPYDAGLYEPAINAVQAYDLAAPDAVVVLESNRDLTLHVDGFDIDRTKRYGSVYVSYGAFT